MVVPAGGGGTLAGSRGWIMTLRAVWPAAGAMAPAAMVTRTWSSGVATRAVAEPVGVTPTVADAEAGALLPLRSSDGGRTHRYGGGGGSPSRSGMPARSPRATEQHAAATSRTPAAGPHTQDRGRPVI